MSACSTAPRHTSAGALSRAAKYAMSVTASPARATAASAAATNDRDDGNRRNSEVCDKNTRRAGGRGGPGGRPPAVPSAQSQAVHRLRRRELDRRRDRRCTGDERVELAGGDQAGELAEHRGAAVAHDLGPAELLGQGLQPPGRTRPATTRNASPPT